MTNDSSVTAFAGGAVFGKKAASKTTPPLALETDFDVVVVGAGIVGLATAREIHKRYPKLTIAVLEKEREVAPHQTGHNSGVIHAGIYYTPGSVMAKTCVKGAAMMYEYCEANKLPYDRSGKLIVASNEQEHKVVEELCARGTQNGVQGLRVISSEEVKKMEPNVAAYSALWSPNTGIADYGAVSRHIAQEIVNTGKADVKLSFEVEEFKKLEDGRIMIKGVEPGQKGPSKHGACLMLSMLANRFNCCCSHFTLNFVSFIFCSDREAHHHVRGLLLGPDRSAGRRSTQPEDRHLPRHLLPDEGALQEHRAHQRVPRALGRRHPRRCPFHTDRE